MLRGLFSLIPSKKFRDNNRLYKNEDLTKLIHRKIICSYTRLEHLYKALDSRTFVISKFPGPKITKKNRDLNPL